MRKFTSRRRMQNYATLCDTIIQHYIIRGEISPHIRRLIVVNAAITVHNFIGI